VVRLETANVIAQAPLAAEAGVDPGVEVVSQENHRN